MNSRSWSRSFDINTIYEDRRRASKKKDRGEHIIDSEFPHVRHDVQLFKHFSNPLHRRLAVGATTKVINANLQHLLTVPRKRLR